MMARICETRLRVLKIGIECGVAVEVYGVVTGRISSLLQLTLLPLLKVGSISK